MPGVRGRGMVLTRRVAFFAHYDPDGVIADYVVHYVACLFAAGVDEVYFASDSNVSGRELAKLPAGTKVVCTSRHGEYDFGSWKRCLIACQQENGIDGLSRFTDLILCNDSCYGPLFSLRPMFNAMDQRECDFWGITQVESSGGYYPSFFLVMRRRILDDPDFIGFLKRVGSFTDKRLYCEQYEMGICRLLEGKGYKGDCYLTQYNHLCHSAAQAMDPATFEAGLPFIRVMTARINPGGIARLGEKIKAVCDRYEYSIGLIQTHLERTAPGYEKYWGYCFPDIEKTLLGIIRIRQKPNPRKNMVRLKIRLLGVPVFYCVYPMLYVKTRKTNSTCQQAVERQRS